ncbi:MAG: hypothetical protein LBK25_04340 [Treponema sp.]|nr:hypothetical protein [Treponema sp.]
MGTAAEKDDIRKYIETLCAIKSEIYGAAASMPPLRNTSNDGFMNFNA